MPKIFCNWSLEFCFTQIRNPNFVCNKSQHVTYDTSNPHPPTTISPHSTYCSLKIECHQDDQLEHCKGKIFTCISFECMVVFLVTLWFVVALEGLGLDQFCQDTTSKLWFVMTIHFGTVVAPKAGSWVCWQSIFNSPWLHPL